MADNVTFTTPAFDAATDQVTGTGEHVQLFKLAIATDGSRTLVPADGTDGLLVNLGANNDVTLGAALPAGTNAIGKLAANSGIDIGDVDVTSVIPGTGATNLGKAEDAGHTTGDVGVMALGVRNDADASLAGTDLDYTPLSVDSGGNQNVKARRDLVRIQVAISGTDTAAYSAGDTMGSIISLSGAARASGGTGTIVAVQFIDRSDVTGAIDVVFSRASITLASNNAAYAISDADALNVIGVVQCAGSYDIGNNRIAQAYNLALPYDCSGGTTLYASIITRAACTLVAGSEPYLTVWVERN